MKKISDYQRLLETDTHVIRRLLNTWTPSAGGLEEKSYEQELFAWLKQQLPGVAMKTQYGIAWGTADLVIEDRFVVELKLAFTPKSAGEFDRCVGQLWRYKEKWVEPKSDACVWLLLVGESEAEFHHLLEKYFKELNAHFFSDPFEWLEKRQT